MLEYFVHLDKDDPPTDLVLAIARIPDDLSRQRVAIGDLPSNWRDAAAPTKLAHFGDEFAQRGDHCLLLVPSVLAPAENNCLINPAHSDYKKIAVLELEPLNYDPRMFGKLRSRPLAATVESLSQVYIKHEVSGQRKIGDRGIGRNVPWAYCLWNLHGVEGLRCAAPALGIMNSDVIDPFCGAGGFFIRSQKNVSA